MTADESQSDEAGNEEQGAEQSAPIDAGPLEERSLVEASLADVRAIFVQEFRSYSGPLPAADEFIRYNEGVPDAANRILTMAEINQRARIEYDLREQNALIEYSFREQAEDSRKAKMGQVCALIIGLAAMVLAGYMVREGQDGRAVAVVFSALAILAGVFIISKAIDKFGPPDIPGAE